MSFAMIFPGQASQYVGMLQEQGEQYPLIQQCFAEASAILGYDLWQLVQTGTKEQLDETTVTQPAVFTASIALWRLWQHLGGPLPALVAGHSLGEYSALVAAGTLAFAEGVALVKKRAELMAAEGVARPGKMLIVLGLADAKVEQLAAEHANGQVLCVANYNSPGQVVAAGEAAAIERLATAASEAGAKRVLPAAVSVASHSQLMAGSQEAMQQQIASLTWQEPQIKIMQNAAVAVPDDLAALQQNLIDQLVCPVRWVQQVAAMRADGINMFVECGPGKVLTGLLKRIDKTVPCYATDGDKQMQAALEAVKGEA